jgi:transcriptional regulator with XRE-family HTH domain
VLALANKDVFASNLQRYMKLAGKTRRDISDALGISYFTITAWTNGSKYPRMDKVEMLANYFGILKSDLIEEKTIETAPVEMAERHFEMVMDEDLNDIFEDFKYLDARERKIVKDLAHSLRMTKTEA